MQERDFFDLSVFSAIVEKASSLPWCIIDFIIYEAFHDISLKIRQ